ncbi:hypothetical protein BS78_K277400 [Paspalum vaginatum]|uniref:Uncharacterized protein n=1 Tax=Paspalum vaginatum TaxID=158149 RepID=A0A9W7X8D2_9POAL|nr:hypothetical protein BS78_K277400 [Paspalum vaginatum]
MALEDKDNKGNDNDSSDEEVTPEQAEILDMLERNSKGNNLDHQLRPLNDSLVIKEMNGAKQSAEAVGCQNALVGKRSALEGSKRASEGRQSGSENVGLSNKNIGENPMHRKQKVSFARFIHEG